MKTITLSDDRFSLMMKILNWNRQEHGNQAGMLDSLIMDIQDHHIFVGSQTIPFSEPKPEAKVEKRCGNCEYFNKNDTCLRYPPIVNSSGRPITTYSKSWCGEFKQKELSGDDIQDIERSMKYPG